MLTLKIVATTLSAVVLVASGVLWIGYHKYVSQIERIDAIPADGNAADNDGEDTNILIVGNDSRQSATDEELAELGTERDGGSLNTDTMILAHIPADGSRASLVSFPRDLWVDIPGIGEHKLNSAFPNGASGGTSPEATAAGARLLTQTISGISGVHIDHYVQVDLLGFYNISKAIGGVEVNLCHAVEDHYSGIDLPAGKQVIEGQQALAFVRQRHGLPNGDIDRIHRQQYFIGAMVNKMTSAGVLLNPVKLNDLLNAVTGSMRMDPDLDPMKLARQLHDLAAGNVEFLTVPTAGNDNIDGQSVVLPDEAAMRSFFAQIGSDHKPAAEERSVPREEVRVEVFNAAGINGLAGQTADQLREVGFTVTGTGDAEARDTTILYSPDREAEAETLAAAVPGATLATDDSLGDTVRLVLGADFGGLTSSGGGGDSAGGGSGADSGTQPADTTPDRTAADTGCIN